MNHYLVSLKSGAIIGPFADRDQAIRLQTTAFADKCILLESESPIRISIPEKQPNHQSITMVHETISGRTRFGPKKE